MKEYYYTKGKDGTIYRAQIMRDEDQFETPRDWDNLCNMYIWHRDYSLGDSTNGKDLWDILYDLMETYLPEVDADDMSENEMRLALPKDKIKIYPIYLYDHSGITISISGEYPYNDRWDGGISGFIIAERETIEEAGCDWNNVYEIAKAEVDNYDMYLVGDVYGYIEDKYLGDDEWEENVDSCWGFYSRKWGEELATEILGELITEEEAIKLCKTYDEKLAKEREAKELEDWLNIVSAIVA